MEKKNRTVPIIVIVIAVIALIVLLVWIFNRSDDAAENTANNTRNEAGVVEDPEEPTLERVLEDPDAYVGENVTVTAEVQDVLSNRIFKISNETIGDELLVITPQPLSEEQAQQAEEFLQDNANVRVEGTVTRATVAEYEQDYDLTLEPGVEAEFENRVVLVADSVDFTDQSGIVWEFYTGTEDINPSQN